MWHVCEPILGIPHAGTLPPPANDKHGRKKGLLAAAATSRGLSLGDLNSLFFSAGATGPEDD